MSTGHRPGRRALARWLAAAALAVAGPGLAGCTGASPVRPASAPAAAPAPADEGDRSARGDAARDRLDRALDRAAPQPAMGGYAGLAPGFGGYVIEPPLRDIHARPGLDLRTRLLTAVAALTALGDSEVPLGNHVRFALNVGCTRDEIVETVMHTSTYAGVPRAVKGLAVVEKVFAERYNELGAP